MNRLGRIIDRGRRLEALPPDLGVERRTLAQDEAVRLTVRARIVYRAVAWCTVCALLICCVVATLFLGAFFETDLSAPVAWLFVAAMAALFGTLVYFLREIYLATQNLRIAPPTQPRN